MTLSEQVRLRRKGKVKSAFLKKAQRVSREEKGQGKCEGKGDEKRKGKCCCVERDELKAGGYPPHPPFFFFSPAAGLSLSCLVSPWALPLPAKTAAAAASQAHGHGHS